MSTLGRTMKLALWAAMVWLASIHIMALPALAQNDGSRDAPAAVDTRPQAAPVDRTQIKGETAPPVNAAPTPDQVAASQATRNGRPTNQPAPLEWLTFKTPYEFWLTLLSIVLVIVMGGMLCVMAAMGVLTPEFLRAFLILVVVFAALFLISAGYTDQQTAPVFSLLGTIAGYIFGRISAPQTVVADVTPAGTPQTGGPATTGGRKDAEPPL